MKEGEPSLEKEIGIKQKLAEAVRSKNQEAVFRMLGEINDKLTGARTGYFAPEAKGGWGSMLAEFFRTAEKGPAAVKIELGDGGVSRLTIFLEENGEVHLQLSPNSAPEVEERWEEMK